MCWELESGANTGLSLRVVWWTPKVVVRKPQTARHGCCGLQAEEDVHMFFCFTRIVVHQFVSAANGPGG